MWNENIIDSIRSVLIRIQIIMVEFYPMVIKDSIHQNQNQAKELEDESIKGLYRLCSRSIQALSLVDILSSSGLKVSWRTLGKISFKSLVISQGVHDKVKQMLADVLGDACEAGKKDIADQISIRLDTQCHDYFSSGDLCLYNASRILDNLAQITVNSSLSLSQVHTVALSECIDLLCKAAKYWNSLGNVRGPQQSDR
jgi:hypothetical protein